MAMRAFAMNRATRTARRIFGQARTSLPTDVRGLRRRDGRFMCGSLPGTTLVRNRNGPAMPRYLGVLLGPAYAAVFQIAGEVQPMCGIVGYVGHRPVQEVLLEGLRKLEYRGYDSAGVSTIADGEVESVRAVGNLDQLDLAMAAYAAARSGD